MVKDLSLNVIIVVAHDVDLARCACPLKLSGERAHALVVLDLARPRRGFPTFRLLLVIDVEVCVSITRPVPVRVWW